MPGTNSPLVDIPDDYTQPGSDSIFTITKGPDQGKKLFYQDFIYGNGKLERTIVFVHGNPENSYTFRLVIKELLGYQNFSARIVAMDHIGFGLSDQASYQMNCADHAENLGYLIENLDLKDVILVVHDWGGPIGIGAFLNQPERVKGLLILNSTVFHIPNKGLTYNNYPISWLGWCKTPLVIPDRYWGAFAVVAMQQKRALAFKILFQLIPKIIKTERLIKKKKSSAAAKTFHQQFQSKANVKSSKRLVRESGCWGEGYSYFDPTLGDRSNHEFYRFIQKSLGDSWGNGKINVKAVVGAWDPTGQPAVLDQWKKHLPQLEGNITVFQECGHFIEEEQPAAIAEAVMGLVTGSP